VQPASTHTPQTQEKDDDPVNNCNEAGRYPEWLYIEQPEDALDYYDPVLDSEGNYNPSEYQFTPCGFEEDHPDALASQDAHTSVSFRVIENCDDEDEERKCSAVAVAAVAAMEPGSSSSCEGMPELEESPELTYRPNKRTLVSGLEGVGHHTIYMPSRFEPCEQQLLSVLPRDAVSTSWENLQGITERIDAEVARSTAYHDHTHTHEEFGPHGPQEFVLPSESSPLGSQPSGLVEPPELTSDQHQRTPPKPKGR
jgi:hypothetical protein